MTSPPARAALVVAHPGHEMRLYDWLRTERPRVFVLTDGSGRAGGSRLASTCALLESIGAEPGDVFGRFTDLAVYRAVLDHDSPLFKGLAEELAAAFRRDGVSHVVGDALEGYNSTHDVCRLVIDAAVEMARAAGSREIASYDFPVVGWPDECPEELRARAVWRHLDGRALTEKLAAAHAYYPELVAESLAAYGSSGAGPLQTYLRLTGKAGVGGGRGPEVFGTECLRPVDAWGGPREFDSHPPFYEWQGEQMVAAGHYDRVIRYREHLAPLAEALRRQSEAKMRSASCGS